MAYDQQLADALREIGVLKRGWETAFNIGVSEQEQNKKLRAEIENLRAALTKIQHLEASDADTWIWTAQETARDALRQSGNKEG